MKLVLFDIDGTLLLTDGAGRRAIHRALESVFGHPGPRDHRFDGKTDPQIVREMMRIAGRDDDTIDSFMEETFERYVDCLREELGAPGHDLRPLPGVNVLLDTLQQRHDATLGLLTGNLVAGARAKLEAVGLDPDRFAVGAFGSDHEVRSELPAVARARARKLGIDVAGKDMVIIGDTPDDIACGRALDVTSIGVATGRFSVDELRACGPAAVFQDLTDTTRIVDSIFR
jgi:phosphoglycolate phosphatase